jgi:hypothetical protein
MHVNFSNALAEFKIESLAKSLQKAQCMHLIILWRIFLPCMLLHLPILDDFNRVVLKELPGVEYSDYINASYVDVRRYKRRPPWRPSEIYSLIRTPKNLWRFYCIMI